MALSLVDNSACSGSSPTNPSFSGCICLNSHLPHFLLGTRKNEKEYLGKKKLRNPAYVLDSREKTWEKLSSQKSSSSFHTGSLKCNFSFFKQIVLIKYGEFQYPLPFLFMCLFRVMVHLFQTPHRVSLSQACYFSSL